MLHEARCSPSRRAPTWWLALVLSAAAATGCGYTPCGTVEYWTGNRVDARYDKNGDGYLDFIEGCGTQAGTFGVLHPSPGVVLLSMSSDHWDTRESVDVAYDYLPLTNVVFRSQLLAKGSSVELATAGGGGWHKPSACGSACLAEAWPVTAVKIDVLEGPSPTDDPEWVQWRLRWDVTVGPADALGPRGRQRLTGEDWVRFYEDSIVLTPDKYPGKPAP